MCKVRSIHFESMYFLQNRHSLSHLFGSFTQWKKSSDYELSSHTSSSCDVESLQLAVEGEDRLALSSRVMDKRDVTEEDEDDEDGIRFVTVESRF